MRTFVSETLSAVRPNTVVVRDCIGHSFFCAKRESRCDRQRPRFTVTLSLRRPAPPLQIDGRGHLAGRLASVMAKELLLGAWLRP